MNFSSVKSVFAALVMSLMLIGAPAVSAQSGANYVINKDWAQLPQGMTWDGSTSWVAADGKGNVVVLVRTAPYIRVFTRDGGFVRAWGDDGLFQSAHSVTFDSQGFIWATDSAGHAVYKFNLEGERLMTLGRKDSAGDNTSRDLFNQPNHVAIAPNGDVYVSDGYQNARVVHFTADGEFVRIIGGLQGSEPGQLQVPHGVAVDSRGRILVNDSDNDRVSVFDGDGVFVETWPYPSRGGIVVTEDDTVYISDVNAGAVNIVKEGELIDSIAIDGRPHGLDVDTDGSIYVSDSLGRMVMKITRSQ